LTAGRALAAAAVVLSLLALAGAPAVRADGDPASDVLLGESVFYPYSPPVAPAVSRALDRETALAARVHFPIKVALIGSPVDLGVIPSLFGKPQQYADFLDQEISFQGTRQPLLVVMAAGYGTRGVPPAAAAAAAGLAKPASTASTDLARAAITAVRAMARAAGHPLPASGSGAGPAGASSGTSGPSAALLAAVIAAALAGAVAVVAVRRRAGAR